MNHRTALTTATLLLVLGGLASAQASGGSKAHPAAKDQLAWYEPKLERQDLVPGAFEVLRFPVQEGSLPRYQRDRKDKKLILDPDFYCTACAREKRIAPRPDHAAARLMETDRRRVLQWLDANLEARDHAFIEDETFQLSIDLGAMNMQDRWNRVRPEELERLRTVFPEIRKKPRFITSHQRAHLYRDRAHALLRDFWWMVGSSNAEVIEKWPHLGPYMGMPNKHEFLVFAEAKHYRAFCDHFLGRVIAQGQSWHHYKDGALCMVMTDDGDPDPKSWGAFLHRISHNYLDAYRRFGFKMPAWFQIGLAHWVERREEVRWNTFCWGEGTIPESLPNDHWLPQIRRRVLRGKVEPFIAKAHEVEFDAFGPEDHLIAYSWFCYLLRLGPERLRIWINAVKGKPQDEDLYPAQIRAFREAYQIDPNTFDSGWRRWVQEIYPDA